MTGARFESELALVKRIADELAQQKKERTTSAHLLAATPTAHWLEYVDWANAILAEPLAITDGFAVPSSRPGSGIAWNDDAVARYRVA